MTTEPLKAPKLTWPKRRPKLMRMSPALLQVQEAASLLGVHANTVRRWVERGYLKAVVNPTGVRRFRRDDIEALHDQMYGGLARPREATDIVELTHVESID